MNRHIPFPDHFSTGLVQLDNHPNLYPGDMVRLRGENGDLTGECELLSVREDDSVMVARESHDKPQHLSRDELQNVLEADTPYVWKLLNRAVIPIGDSVSDSLVLFAYAFDHEDIPEGDCMLALVWSVTEQDPVAMMPTADGMVSSPRFDSLREALVTGNAGEHVKAPGNALERLYREFDEQRLSAALDDFIVVAEFNAMKVLSFHTEPTFSEDTRQRLERDATPMENSIEAASSLYD